MTHKQSNDHGSLNVTAIYKCPPDLPPVTRTVIDGFYSNDVQRLDIVGQVHFAPLVPVFGYMLLAFPFAFAQELHAGAIDQQVRRRSAGTVGQLHSQRFLASADSAAVRHRPIPNGQPQQAFDQTQGLKPCQAEEALDAQVKLDADLGARGMTVPLSSGAGIPLHAFVQLDRH